jgi:DNA-binding response OmpR family regulator
MQTPSKIVLVVEDDKFLANAYRVKCQNEDFNVLVASDGNEGLRILEETTPDVILLDLVMPNKDGFEFMTEVNKDPELKKIPILIASNLGQEEDLKKAMEMGAKDYVIKSDTPLEEILEKIRNYL